MKTWLTRGSRVVGMGLLWACAWALAGLLVGLMSILLPGLPWEAIFGVFDAPLPALAIPGFVGGLLFSIVLRIAPRRRKLVELSLPGSAALGAVSGVLLSLVPAAMIALRMASLNPGHGGVWHVTAVIGGPLVLLCTLSAAGTVTLARVVGDRELLGH